MRFWLGLLLWPLLSAAAVLGVCLFLPLTYTAVATIAIQPSARGWEANGLPPQLPSLAQYGALLQSRRVADRIIDEFALQTAYGEPTREQTRERLARNVVIGGTRGGLIVIQASDRDRQRAAELANQFANELQRLLDELRVEAAHTRADRLNADVARVQQRVAEAQRQLQAARLHSADMRLEPRWVAAPFFALQQALQASDQRLAALRVRLQDGSADVQRELALRTALAGQLQQAAAGTTASAAHRYSEATRDVRLLEPWLKQLRVHAMQAEMDAGIRHEAVLGVDAASVPERPSGPLALLYMIVAWAVTLAWLLFRAWRRYRRSGGIPASAATSRA